MKPVNNYILLVDSHRRPSRKRNTAGRYRVGAKSEKEAIKLLREKIKFGSTQCYYQTTETIDIKNKLRVDYKTVVQEISGYQLENNGKTKHLFYFQDAHSAIDPQN